MKKYRKTKAKSEAAKPLHEPKPDAAGIDVGANEIWVAVPADRTEEPVRRFGAFTGELQAIVQWLRDWGIVTVAMESTGVYWIPLYQLLADAGLKVCLVNARHVKNVPGRKSDVRDCQWLQYLHSVGLLRASYRPDQAVCAARSIYRYRQNLLTQSAQHVQHMQAALDQMNIKLHHVITLMTELGNDLSAFKTAHHFSSWLCLCPDNETSASKVLRRATRRSQNRVRQALRMATSTLHHDKSYLGDKYRRLRAKLGAPKAITAMAHQLARIIWHLIVHRVPFDLTIFAAYEKANQTRRLKRLSSAARQMGYQLTPIAA
jgi:transposase